MATSIETITPTAYSLVSSVDCFIVNSSAYNVRISLSPTLPTTNTPHFFILKPEKAFQKINDFPTGNIYAISDRIGEEVILSVSE
jgi:hypothetical protein